MHDGLARLRLALGWVVLVAWVASFGLSVASTLGFPVEWTTPPRLDLLMGFVTGALFAPDVVKRFRNARNGEADG